MMERVDEEMLAEVERRLGPLQTPNGSSGPSVREPDEYHLEEIVKAGLTTIKEIPGPLSAEEQRAELTNGKWEPSVLRPRHREILSRILEGATYVEIAEAMGIHKQTVMLVATSPLFRAELAKLEAEADFNIVQRAESMSNEALDKIKTLMRSARSEFLQKQCADRILDTAGYSKIERKIVGVVSGEDVIRELNKRRREAAGAPTETFSPAPEIPTSWIKDPRACGESWSAECGEPKEGEK